MSARFRASRFGLIVIVALAVSAMSTALHGQAASKKWTSPRTPDGHPDLQGTWLIRTATPLERPKALEGKALLTDEEVATLKHARIRFSRMAAVISRLAMRYSSLPSQGRHRFTSVTSTHGSEDMIEREFDHHTSLVTDPTDGHIPPLTPEGRRRREAIAAAARRADGPEDLDNAFRCISWGVPRLGGRYGAGDLAYYQIVQTPGMSCCSWKRATKRASSRWMGGRTWLTAPDSGLATRVAVGTATRWSSIPSTFLRRTTSWARPSTST